MWGVYRWAARFLLLVMLAPAYTSVAMACAAPPKGMHCTRARTSAPQPAMPCHHAMLQSTAPPSESSENSLRAADNCCQDHRCCGCVTTSEWAHPASAQLSFLNLRIEPARPASSAILQSSDISGHDSARAPPTR